MAIDNTCRAERRSVLTDVLIRTGNVFFSIGVLGEQLRAHADEGILFGILCEWVERSDNPVTRSDIYLALGKSRLRVPIPHSIRWLRLETDVLNKSQVTGLMMAALRNTNCHLVWDCRECYGRQNPARALLLSRLIRFRRVSNEVASFIVSELRSGELSPGEVKTYEKLDHPVVAEWYIRNGFKSSKENEGTTNKQNTNSKPKYVRTATGDPDYEHELYSTQVDVEDAPGLLKLLAEKHGVPGSRAAIAVEFVISKGSPFWYCVDFCSSPLKMWLRAEDEDQIEVVLTRHE